MPDSPSRDTPAGSATEVQHVPPLHLFATDVPGPGDRPAPDGELRVAGTSRYRLLEEIARGGMGVVYRAEDGVFGREVGLKTVLKLPAEGSVLALRFREEARITGQLQHPNIPPVHDLGTLPDGRPFLAMKLIKGHTLDAMLKARPDPSHEPGRYLAIFERIAQGVAYAHAHRVIHRDLKPANVMVGDYGEVQVMDWGLAKVLSDKPSKTQRASDVETGPSTNIRPSRDESDETRAGSIFGTPAYMPREQAIGAVDQIDTRSDVFSLGGILCTILTGKPPYVGSDGESTRQLAALAKIDDAFARLEACGVEANLIALCQRCLSPERDDRPRDASDVAKAVAELRADAERRAREAQIDRARAELQTAEQRKRRKVQLALAVVVMLLLTGVGAFAWWEDRQTTAARTEETLRKAAERAEEDRRTARAEGEATAALTEMNALCDRGRQELENPPRWRLILTSAQSAHRRATTAIDAAPASDELRAAFRDAAARLAREEFDCETAELCEKWMVEVFLGVKGDSRMRDFSGLHRRADALFARLGLDLATTSPDAVVAALEKSRLRYQLTAILAIAIEPGVVEWQHVRLPVAERVFRQIHPLQEALRESHRKGQLDSFFANGSGKVLSSTELVCLYMRGATDSGPQAESWGRVLNEALLRNPANLFALTLRGAAPATATFSSIATANGTYNVLTTPALPSNPVSEQPHPLTERQVREVTAITNAIAVRPDLPALWSWAGNNFARCQLPNLAAERFHRAIELDATNPDDAVGLANALMSSGRYAEAVEAYRRVLARFPALVPTRYPTVLTNAARCAVFLAEDDQTRAQLTPDQRRDLRLSALRWLREWARGRTPTGKDVFLVRRDPALRSVRDPVSLDRLPPDEIGRWLALWDEIQAIKSSGQQRYVFDSDPLWRLQGPNTREPAPPPREVNR